MNENAMAIIGAIISIWVSFLIWTVYPDVARGFIFAMGFTWIVIFFYLGVLYPGELDEDQNQIKGDDGKVLNTKIFKKKDYHGKYDEIAPDIIVYFDDLQYGCNTTLIGNPSLWSPRTAIGGDDVTHSQQGIFIINNSKKGDIGEIDIVDVAPTILNELEIKVPEDMKGRIIS